MTTATPTPVLPEGIRVTDDLVRLVRNPPPGTSVIYLDRADGELRALRVRDRGQQSYGRVWPSGNRYVIDTRDYVAVSWDNGHPHTTDITDLLAAAWVEVPMDLGAPEPVTVNAPVLASSERIEQLRSEIRRAGEAADAADLRRRRAEQDLRAFQEQVVEVATRYANENDNRSQVEEVLNELGLELGEAPGCDYSAELTIVVRFSAHRVGESYTPDSDWVLNSLSGQGQIESAISRYLELDDDSENLSVNDVSFEITDVEED